MAKGQKRSNKETKKPKKSAPAKPSAGATSAFTQAPGTADKPRSKKG